MGDITARRQLESLKTKAQNYTSEDVIELKRQKQILIEEQWNLKAKIGRFESLGRREKTPARNKQIATSICRQVETLKALVTEKKESIQFIIDSDLAAQITELQEESKMKYLELLRLSEEKERSQRLVDSESFEVFRQKQVFSISSLEKQEHVIGVLESRLLREEEVHSSLLRQLSSERSRRESPSRLKKVGDLSEDISLLRSRIRDEQSKIKSLSGEIKRTNKESSEEIQVLQETME